MDYGALIEKAELFEKRIGNMVKDFSLKVRNLYLRLKGEDPDLLAKIIQLDEQCEEYRTIIKKQHENSHDLREQIEEMEIDFHEFKRRYLDYLKSSSDWRSKSEALAVFLDYLEKAIPLTDDEEGEISKAHELTRQSKVNSIRMLFHRLVSGKKKPPLSDTKSNS